MEQSKLISGIIAKLKVTYNGYFQKLGPQDLAMMVKIYQEQLDGYEPTIVMKAVDEIIRGSRFMPTIAEIIDQCRKQIANRSTTILEFMKKEGYFKFGVCGELPIDQQEKNYDKAIKFVEEKVVPTWLERDMKEYESKYIASASNKQIEMS